ncbi:lipase member H-like isoform X2 [Adelges cooleyi]|uniref:lipase member H-like isoform X2 n=1 Tax=Adelges cooleyi TaxID=133065 RepID=UPI00217F6296|nr:lipase member H-like isoform X2 [Adelges cooleyi]
MIVAIALVLVTFHLSDAQIIGTVGNVLKNTENAVENTGNAIEETANEDLDRILPTSIIVNNTSLKFSYWNHLLGNEHPIVFTIDQEKDLLNYWIPGQGLKVVTHGWLATSENSTGVFTVKTAYVSATEFNVISMDWSAIGDNYIYPIPALMTRRVGSVMARMLENLVRLAALDPGDIHLIGHSLGAHVSGACGAAFTLGKIGRITGLDPAGPGFEYVNVQTNRLDKTDALFVDVIHTAAGAAGYYSSLGHVDFFPNEGCPPQPGCYDGLYPSELMGIVGCSHARAHKLYTDSVYHMRSMLATKCSSWSSYKSGQCKNNPKTYMGHDASPSVSGDFYLKTASSPPYGINENADTTIIQSARKNV